MSDYEAKVHRLYAAYVDRYNRKVADRKTFEEFKAEKDIEKGVVDNLRGFIKVRRMFYPWNSNLEARLKEYERNKGL